MQKPLIALVGMLTHFLEPLVTRVATLGCILNNLEFEIKIKSKMCYWSKIPHAVVTWAIRFFFF